MTDTATTIHSAGFAAELVSVAAAIISALLLFIYVRCPLKRVHEYRYFFLMTAIQDAILALCCLALTPITISRDSAAIFMATGILRRPPFGSLLLFIFSTAFVFSLLIITNSFIYRYVHLCKIDYTYIYTTRKWVLVVVSVNVLIVINWIFMLLFGRSRDVAFRHEMNSVARAEAGIDLDETAFIGFSVQAPKKAKTPKRQPKHVWYQCTDPEGWKAWLAWTGNLKREPGIGCTRQPVPPPNVFHALFSREEGKLCADSDMRNNVQNPNFYGVQRWCSLGLELPDVYFHLKMNAFPLILLCENLILMFGLLLIMCFCAIQITLTLKKATLSKNAKKHHRQMFTLLLLQTASPALFMYAPLGLMYVMLFSGTSSSVTMSTVTATLFSIFPAVDPVILISFLREYREYVLRTVGLGRRERTVSPTSHPTGRDT